MSTSSSFLNLQTSYYIDLNEDHELLRYRQAIDQCDTAPIELLSIHPQSSIASASSFSSSSSVPSPCSNQVQEQAGYCFMGSQLHPSAHHLGVSGSYEQAEINKRTNNILKFSLCRKDDKNNSGGGGSDGGVGSGEINHSSVNWMPPKMRLTKKMLRVEEDRKQHPPPLQVRSDANLISKPLNENNSNNNSNKDNTMIRVCSDCNTTKTPLWRSGPRGPKSLCNACGIRQRKARRAMAAAASGSFISNSLSSSMMRNENSHKKGSNKNNVPKPQKKRCKVANKPPRDHHHHNTFQRKLCFEEFSFNLTKKLSLHQVFPKEEKEAAILLMALSCGLVQG